MHTAVSFILFSVVMTHDNVLPTDGRLIYNQNIFQFPHKITECMGNDSNYLCINIKREDCRL